MLKQLLLSGALLISAAPQALAGPTGFWGTSQVPNVECNIWGCPNPPLGAECTIHGCPSSPPLPQQPVYPPYPPYPYPYPSSPYPSPAQNSNPQKDGGSGFGECMDRMMYQDFRAKSGPDSSGRYTFDLPNSLTKDQIRQAGFKYSGPGFNQHEQSVVKIQVKTAEQAAPVCR